jgi:hypothetical protein
MTIKGRSNFKNNRIPAIKLMRGETWSFVHPLRDRQASQWDLTGEKTPKIIKREREFCRVQFEGCELLESTAD